MRSEGLFPTNPVSIQNSRSPVTCSNGSSDFDLRWPFPLPWLGWLPWKARRSQTGMAVSHPVFSLLSDFPSMAGSSPVGVGGGARGFPCDRCRTQCSHWLLWVWGGHSSLLKSMLCSPPALVCTLGPSHAWSCPCSALRASFLAGLNTFPIFSFFLVENDRFQEACCMEVRPALMLLHPYLVLCLWEVHSVLSWRNVFHLVQPSPLPMHIAWVASMLLPLSSIFSVDTCQRFEWFSWNSSQQVCDEFTMALNTLSHSNIAIKSSSFPFLIIFLQKFESLRYLPWGYHYLSIQGDSCNTPFNIMAMFSNNI